MPARAGFPRFSCVAIFAGSDRMKKPSALSACFRLLFRGGWGRERQVNKTPAAAATCASRKKNSLFCCAKSQVHDNWENRIRPVRWFLQGIGGTWRVAYHLEPAAFLRLWQTKKPRTELTEHGWKETGSDGFAPSGRGSAGE